MNQFASAARPRVLVVSPLYFPVEEGLAHYTTEFCRHLQKSADVSVLTSTASAAAASGPGGVTVLPWVKRWDLPELSRAFGRALRTEPDRVLIQFVPFMYSRRGGINFSIVAVAAALALRARLRGRGSVEVMFHELWYPFSTRPRDIVLHTAHRLMVMGLGAAARDVFCATERFVGEVSHTLGPLVKSVHLLEVGSNLERDDAQLAPRPPQTGALRLALFGSLHPSKNVPMVLRALERATRIVPGKLKVSVIGLERAELLAVVPELQPWLDAEVTITGQLPAAEAAATLAAHDCLVSYFQDGVSSRRGSLLAALCEGVPVITTWRDISDRVFLNQPCVKLFSPEPEEFAEQLVEFVTAEARPFATVTAEEVHAFYRAHFSWAAVVDRYLELAFAPG